MKLLTIMMHPAAGVPNGVLEYLEPEEWDFNVSGVYIKLKDGRETHINTTHVIAVSYGETTHEE